METSCFWLPSPVPKNNDPTPGEASGTWTPGALAGRMGSNNEQRGTEGWVCILAGYLLELCSLGQMTKAFCASVSQSMKGDVPVSMPKF